MSSIFGNYFIRMTRENFLQDMGLRISKKRIEKNISQRQLSLAAGKEESYMNRVELGKVNVSILAFLEICKLLEIDPKDFFI